VDLLTHIFERPLSELVADAPALVDELAQLPDVTLVEDRPPIRVAIVSLEPASSEHANAIAIAAVPGGRSRAIRWKRAGNTIDARDDDGASIKAPDLQKVTALGDARMLATAILRLVQRPFPAVAMICEVRYMLEPETTLGRTAISDIVIADDRLSKLTWRYEWSDDAWWVRCFDHTGNITLNGEPGWQRRELKHGDVIGIGAFAVRFALAD
jgi:hypothetical protein